MLQAALSDCQFLDLFPFSDDGLAAPEVDVGGCDVVQALVVALVVVVTPIFQMNPLFHAMTTGFCYKKQCHIHIRTDALRTTQRVKAESPLCGLFSTAA